MVGGGGVRWGGCDRRGWRRGKGDKAVGGRGDNREGLEAGEGKGRGGSRGRGIGGGVGEREEAKV